jgi:hypothetical protein
MWRCRSSSRGKDEALQRGIEIINVGPIDTCTSHHMREELVTRTLIAAGRDQIAAALTEVWTSAAGSAALHESTVLER